MSPETKSIPFSGIDKQRFRSAKKTRVRRSRPPWRNKRAGELALSLSLYLLRVDGSLVWRDRISFAGVACGAVDDSLE